MRNQSPERFFIESFGVTIGFYTYSPKIIEDVCAALGRNLPGCFQLVGETDPEHDFFLIDDHPAADTFYINGEEIMKLERKPDSIEFIASRIRLTVAEFARRHVFIHAGVVARKNKAIVFPGRSMHGKTTLTAALIERGAVYYSDEYAILGADGLVAPFAKMLSVRGEIDEYRQIDYPVEKFGAISGTDRIPLGMFLLTEFSEKARWNPQFLTPAGGILEIIEHTVPMRRNPRFALEVLQKTATGAVIVKSQRPDVESCADQILRFIDENL